MAVDLIDHYKIAAGSSSASADVNAVGGHASLYAKGADIRYDINTAATTTSYFIGEKERINIKIHGVTQIHALRDASTDGTLEVTAYYTPPR